MPSYDPKNENVYNNQLKVQHVDLSIADSSMYTLVNSGADMVIMIGEPVLEVRACSVVDNSAAAIVVKAASTISIVDSTAFTAGGDAKAIKVTGLGTLLAANDLATIKYVLGK